MKRLAILAAVLLAPAFPAGAQDPKPTEMTLAAKVPNPKAKRPLLNFDGSIPLPDQTVLFLSVARVQESWIAGRIEPTHVNAGSSLAQVKDRKFSLQTPIDGPGLFVARVDLRDELQNPKTTDYLKKTPVNPKMWNFAFSAWGDDLPGLLASALQDFDVLAQDAGEMVKRYETACKTEEAWKAAAKELSGENAKLLRRCEGSSLRAFYPAALNQVHYTIRNLQGNSPYFTFVDGKFTGATSYHADEQKVKTFRDEAFTYENFKRYVSEGIVIAGREFSLWHLKDYKRAGQSSGDALSALTQMKAHAGVAEFFERLKAIKTPEEFEVLDKDIRQMKVVAAAPEKPNEKK